MWKLFRDVLYRCEVLRSFGSFVGQHVLFLNVGALVFTSWGKIAYLDEVPAVVVGTMYVCS